MEKKEGGGWGGRLRARGEGSGKSSQRRRPEEISHMRTGGKVKSRMDNESFIFNLEIIRLFLILTHHKRKEHTIT